MTGEHLHPVITEHRDWAAFDEEQAKAQRLLAKSQFQSAKAEARWDWESAMAAYDAEVTDAALNGREPGLAIEEPGSGSSRDHFWDAGAPVEVVHKRLGQVDAMRSVQRTEQASAVDQFSSLPFNRRRHRHLGQLICRPPNDQKEGTP